jgi:hypothetical protein
MIEAELEAALYRPRYARRPKEASKNADGASGVTGHRHGHFRDSEENPGTPLLR